jgi:hypothetical protein
MRRAVIDLQRSRQKREAAEEVPADAHRGRRVESLVLAARRHSVEQAVGAGAAEGEANEVPENSKEMEGGYERLPRVSVPCSSVDTLAGLRSAGLCCREEQASAECRAGDDEARTALEGEEERIDLLCCVGGSSRPAISASLGQRGN